MKITVEEGGYNGRRYSKPWIARVKAWGGSRPDLEFGTYLGDASGGRLQIEEEAGQPVYSGQKDYRKPSNSVRNWYLVQPDGSLEPCTEPEAYDAYHVESKPANPLAGFSDAELLAEMERRNLI